MGEPGLTGRRINGTQRSLSSQWNKPNAHRSVCEHRTTKYVCPGHGCMEQQGTGRAARLLGVGGHITSLQEETKRAVQFTKAGGTALAEGQSPDCDQTTQR